MKTRKFAVTAALLIAAIGVTAGTANGAPAPITPGAPAGSATPATGVNYKADRVGNAAVVTIDAGKMAVDKGIFTIKADNGTVLAAMPMTFRLDQYELPIDAKIEGRKATITPRLKVADAVYKPVALPFEESAPWKTPYDREVAAFTRMRDTITTAGVIGAAVGVVAGGIIGCGAGALVGAVVTGVLLELFGAGPLAGCLAGVGIAVPVGGVIGALLITIPVSIASIAQYVITINEPFVSSPNKPAPAR